MNSCLKVFGIVFFCLVSFLHAMGVRDFSRSDTLYASPLDISINLSGNYGEIRSTHFHAGMDIKTDQVEGKRVLAAREGFVYRIVVQSGGYGKAIYLRHKDGQVTVYAHLQQFVPDVERYVKDCQYRLRSFEVDLFPEEELFTFNQGELLGLSGNTGNSFGPHLHFELRDSQSIPLNPLLHGFSLNDHTSPVITWLAIYPMNSASTVNGQCAPLIVPVKIKQGNIYQINTDINVSGDIGLGIETFDLPDRSANRCQVYALHAACDLQPFFGFVMDSIPFALAPAVNSHVDFAEKLQSGRLLQKLYVDPNNPLKIYVDLVNDGILSICDTATRNISIKIVDVNANEAFLEFALRGKTQMSNCATKPTTAPDQMFLCNTLSVFENDDIRLAIPKNALFRDLAFHYAQYECDSCMFSPVYEILDQGTPLFSSYMLAIRARNLPAFLQAKALIVSIRKNGAWVCHGGEYAAGFVSGRVKEFGQFMVRVDTMAPTITRRSDDPIAKPMTLTFHVSDDLSGIGSYNGFVDGKWALLEYDAKNGALTYKVDEQRIERNHQHTLDLIISDRKNNIARCSASFYY